jgi:hypothetical protein
MNFNDTVCFLVEHYPNIGFTKCKVESMQCLKTYFLQSM